MAKREEFQDLLYGTFYESVSDPASIRQQHEKIRTWVQNNIPSRLYRYRAVNEHTFDALRKDEIWGSSIFSFNDPFECMPHYDPERAKELLKREMDMGRIAEKYRVYKNGGSAPALQGVFSEEQLQWLFSVLPEDIHPEALEKPFSLFRENALRLLECCQDEFEMVFYRTLIDEQKRRSVACFNEWRMISMLPDNTLFRRIYSLKPTAVYIGVRTDEEAANTLYQICCEKDIPCYKMVPAYLSGSFSIRPLEYETHIEVTDRLKQKNML